MRMRMRDVAVAAALLALAAPGMAVAGVVGTIPVDAAGGVGGFFREAGTQTWGLRLERGRYYAISGGSGAYERVTVRRPGGAAVATFVMADGDYPGEGASFRAPVDGTYAVDVSLPQRCRLGDPCLDPDRETDSGVQPGAYGLTVGRDCPGDAATPCTIIVGQTLHGLWASFSEDRDTFRVTLQRGVAYDLSVPAWPAGGDLYASVADASGRPLPGAATGGLPLRFTAPATGAYYVSAVPSEALGQYDLSLAVAR